MDEMNLRFMYTVVMLLKGILACETSNPVACIMSGLDKKTVDILRLSNEFTNLPDFDKARGTWTQNL